MASHIIQSTWFLPFTNINTQT